LPEDRDYAIVVTTYRQAYAGSAEVLLRIAGTPTSCPLPLAASDRAPRVQWLQSGLAQAVGDFERKFADGHGGIACTPADGSTSAEVHGFGDYAFAKLLLAAPGDAAAAALAGAAIRCLFSYQATQSGVFPFHLGDPARARDNGTEFALKPLALAWD